MLKVKKLNDNAFIPRKKYPQDAGWDLYALEDVMLKKGKITKIDTGLAFVIPEGFYGRVADRSSMAYKNGITTLAGVIDSTYRGEVSVVLMNLSSEDYQVKKGDRIAQLIITSIYPFNKDLKEVYNLEETERGRGGFGSTGK